MSLLSFMLVVWTGCKGVSMEGPYVSGEREEWVDGNSNYSRRIYDRAAVDRLVSTDVHAAEHNHTLHLEFRSNVASTFTGAGIDNCAIHNTALVALTYQPSVTLSGSGSVARNNDIRTSPHFGISLGGNDQTVDLNIVHHTSEDTFDNGPVYWCPRNWASRGHRIVHNFFYLNSNKIVPCNPRTSCEKPAICKPTSNPPFACTPWLHSDRVLATADGDDGSSGSLIYGNVIYHPNPGFAPAHGAWNRGSGVKYWGVFFDGSRVRAQAICRRLRFIHTF